MEDRYKAQEPGISHPLKRTSIRLTNDGKIEILAGDHAGIILDSETGIISIYGTEIRFLSGDITVNGKFLSDAALIESNNGVSSGTAVKKILGKMNP